MNPDYDPNTQIRAEQTNQIKQAERKAQNDYLNSDLKEDINNFLWTRLPDNTTLNKADEIAFTIYNQIILEWDNQE
jgi:hypothetical protein